MARGIPGTGGDDRILIPSTAGAGTDAFGRGGNDRIETGAGDDILTGGTGNDLLLGHGGGDTNFFAPGDGQDTIEDVSENSGTAPDRLRFGAGIAPEDIRALSVGPADLVLGVAGSEDRVTLRNFFAASPRDTRIEEIAFADGTRAGPPGPRAPARCRRRSARSGAGRPCRRPPVPG
ncbi:calcium-binding protein [Mangrovicoccus ximenensis]|uniref:calcium-binding protein n=1 Tax=Mangrovicoccus ximenensis TaxID=1911570 RepID=UPI0013749C4C